MPENKTIVMHMGREGQESHEDEDERSQLSKDFDTAAFLEVERRAGSWLLSFVRAELRASEERLLDALRAVRVAEPVRPPVLRAKVAKPSKAAPAAAEPERPAKRRRLKRGGRRSLRVGRVLRRAWEGKVHEVQVAEGGFVYRGKEYRSLSAVGKRITGYQTNGWVFFGVSERRR